MEIMTLAEILDRSVEVIKKHIKTIILFTLAYGIIFIIGVFLFAIIGSLLAVFSGAVIGSGYLTVIIIILLGVVLASIGLTHYAGIIKISSQEFSKEEILTDKAVKAAFKSIFKLIGIIICLLIMFLPAAAVFYFLGKVFFGSIDSLIYSIDTLIGSGAGAVALFTIFILSVVFILFSYMTWIVFVFHAMVLEQKGVFASIKRSFSLVRKSYWRIFGSLILIVFVVYALQLSLGSFAALISSIFYLLTKFLSINQDIMSFFTMVASYISLPLNIVSWLVILPIGYIMTTMLYFNERFKKEGYDLSLRLKEIQNNQERKQVSEFDD